MTPSIAPNSGTPGPFTARPSEPKDALRSIRLDGLRVDEVVRAHWRGASLVLVLRDGSGVEVDHAGPAVSRDRRYFFVFDDLPLPLVAFVPKAMRDRLADRRIREDFDVTLPFVVSGEPDLMAETLVFIEPVVSTARQKTVQETLVAADEAARERLGLSELQSGPASLATPETADSSESPESAAASLFSSLGWSALGLGALGVAQLLKKDPAQRVTDVSGTVAAGPMLAGVDLKVQAFELDGRIIDGAVGVVDANGHYTLQIKKITGPVRLRVLDANGDVPDYRDEATGQTLDIGSLESVVVIDGSGGVQGQVNALTTLAASHLGAGAGGTDVDTANLAVARLFGVGDLQRGSPNLVIDAEGQARPDADAYGKSLAFISYVEAATSLSPDALLAVLSKALVVQGSQPRLDRQHVEAITALRDGITPALAGAHLTFEDLAALLTSLGIGSAPLLTRVATQTGVEDTSVMFTYAELKSASDLRDLDSASGQLGLVITMVANGSLEVQPRSVGDWLPVVAGRTRITDGDALRWTGHADQNGDVVAFTIRADDGELTSTSDIAVRVILRANGQAEIRGTADAMLMQGDEALTASGVLTSTDVDGSANRFVVVNEQRGTGDSYGRFSVAEDGHWSYAMDGAHRDLAAGEVRIDAFVVTADDGATRSVEVTIKGVNDAPVAIAGTASATEDGSKVNGQLSSTDVDRLGATARYTLDAPVAGLTLKADGSYEFDPGVSAYQDLAVHQRRVVVANYTVTDDQNAEAGNTLTIEVTGVDDPATGVISIIGTVQEGGQLAVDTSGVVDVDGMLPSFNYQWQIASSAEGPWSDVAAVGDGRSYQIATDHSQVGKFFRVAATVTDDGASSSVRFTSDATPAVAKVGRGGDPVIDLGAGNGQLILPCHVDGKWYYHWDKDGSGDSSPQDVMNHDVLDATFRYAIDFTSENPASDTTNSFRFGSLNGVKLALPTIGDGKWLVSANYSLTGTAVNNEPANQGNETYDDLAAIWDAYNGNGVEATFVEGRPAEWREGFSWWSATPAANGHASLSLLDGKVASFWIGDQAQMPVVLQVL